MPTNQRPLELMVCGHGGPSVWPIMACCYINSEVLSSCHSAHTTLVELYWLSGIGGFEYDQSAICGLFKSSYTTT